MKLYVNNEDVTATTYINEAIYETFSEDKADRIRIVFNDKDGAMSKYRINNNARFRITEGAIDTGVMFVKKAMPINGQYEIIATSLPRSIQQRKNKEYKDMWLLQIMTEIAKANGLTLKNYGCENYFYKSMKQQNESDIEFSNRILTYEGYKVIINNLVMIIYDPFYIEKQNANGTIEIGDDGRFKYFDNRFKSYGYALVSYDKYSGKYVIDSSNNSCVIKTIAVTSNAQALRYAKGILREANKNQLKGYFIKELLKGVAGASLLNITNKKSAMCNGKVFVYHARHDFVNNQSKIFFRKPLNF